MAGKLADEARKDKWFALFEHRLQKGPYFLGDKHSVVDFFGLIVFEWLDAKGITYDKFPNVTTWRTTTVTELPAVKKLYATGVPMIPQS
mmetsp:Transcript_23880/g.94702  ORF Transcript_23880/g.94702 Transcript_23880/m.94702 type:complete len:89 (-) Transcript_23880:189-455(-)